MLTKPAYLKLAHSPSVLEEIQVSLGQIEKLFSCQTQLKSWLKLCCSGDEKNDRMFILNY